MSMKKNDLKMMYSLRWKHDPKREASSFVFVYDIPSITMNYDVFKNYLLKNSGNPEEDIRVSYIRDNGRECPIDSQEDFQMALYTFRRSARAGDVINLLLERISPVYSFKTLRQSNDVETQIEPRDSHSIDSASSNGAEPPPEWFKTAIEQLKIEIRNELISEMSSIACDFIESQKLERKLEATEQKASKCREVQLALQEGESVSDSESKSSDSEAGAASNTVEVKEVEEEPKMDARPIKVQTSYPHMLGGEIYLHQWQVQNTGQVTWDSTTELQYTWGSKNLVPVEKRVLVPFLKPGEEGVISVCLNIPTQSGVYECYWQFMHKGRRFGHSLGVQVIVDGFDWKGDSEMVVDSEINAQVVEIEPQPNKHNRSLTDENSPVLDTSAKTRVVENDEDTNTSIKLPDEELDSIVVITLPKNEQVREGFIYVHVDGQKVLIPKNILKSEVVTAAEERSSVRVDSASFVSSTSTQLVEQPSLQESLTTQAVDLTTRTLSEHSSNSRSTVSPRNAETVANPVINMRQLEERVTSELSSVIDDTNQSQILANQTNRHSRQWISADSLSPREQNLQALVDMGFWNFDLNSTLLDRFNDDLNQTVAELLR